MKVISRGVPLALLLVSVCGCGPLANLRSDLKQIDADFRRGSADVQFSGSQTVVLLVFEQGAGTAIEQFDILHRPGSIELWLPASSLNAFAFMDANGDLSYQPGEGCAAASVDARTAKPTDVVTFAVRLPDAACSAKSAPTQVTNGGSVLAGNGAALPAHFAEMARLDDPRFTPEQGSAGMWQPLEFVKSNAAGLFMLEPYDPRRVPVLFVHGIAGSPRDFSYLVEHLDKQRFQAWVLSYPSGLALEDLAHAMHRTLARTRYKLNFSELHIVAHSMGGLVSRGYLNECSRAKDCAYVRSLTTIASPFGGHSAAQKSLDFAPVVAPVWRDMAPGSAYLNALFATPLPPNIPHHLLFTFHHEGLGNTSSDGTIDVSSQLRVEAQVQATTLYGFDETHMSVLSSEATAREMNALLSKNGGRSVSRSGQ